ncbi:hypothetical protein A1D22_02815 [Pasteurellaceae bacterium LFhippo2]|nr:hypothetical protein [Pasteurellaceae bacterium LFhippo2]
MTVTYTDEEGKPQTVTVAKDPATGEWAPTTALPEGVTVDKDGTVNIPQDGVEDNSPVKAVGTNEDAQTAEDEKPAGEDLLDPADAPVVTPSTEDGSVSVKPGDDNVEMTVTYTDEEGKPQTVTVAKDPATGEWAPTTALPEGVTVDKDGTVNIPQDAVKDNSPVNAVGTNEDAQTADADEKPAGDDLVADPATITFVTAAADNDYKGTGSTGTALFADYTRRTDGTATITSGANNEKVVVKYTSEETVPVEAVSGKPLSLKDLVDNGEKPGVEQEITFTKGADGKWVAVSGMPTVEKSEYTNSDITSTAVTYTTDASGNLVVTLQPNAVKDGTDVTVTTSATGHTDSVETAVASEDTKTYQANFRPLNQGDKNALERIKLKPEPGSITLDQIMGFTRATLVYTDPEGNPQEATFVRHSEDRISDTASLRDGVKWEILDPVTGETSPVPADYGILFHGARLVIEPGFAKEGTNIVIYQSNDLGDIAISDGGATVPVLTVLENPEVTPTDTGAVDIKLPESAKTGDTAEVTFTPEGSDTPVKVTLTKNPDGTWTSDNPDLVPSTTADNPNGTTIPADKVADNTPVSVMIKDPVTGERSEPVKAETNEDALIPDAANPVVTPSTEDGSVSVKPGDDNDKMTVSYTDEQGKPQTVTVAKDPATGNWAPEGTLPAGVTVDKDGTVNIPEEAVADNSPVKAVGEAEGYTPSEEVAKDAAANKPKEPTPLTITSVTPYDNSAKADSNADIVTVVGKSDPGAVVTATVGGVTVGTATADANGDFTMVINDTADNFKNGDNKQIDFTAIVDGKAESAVVPETPRDLRNHEWKPNADKISGENVNGPTEWSDGTPMDNTASLDHADRDIDVVSINPNPVKQTVKITLPDSIGEGDFFVVSFTHDDGRSMQIKLTVNEDGSLTSSNTDYVPNLEAGQKVFEMNTDVVKNNSTVTVYSRDIAGNNGEAEAEVSDALIRETKQQVSDNIYIAEAGGDASITTGLRTAENIQEKYGYDVTHDTTKGFLTTNLHGNGSSEDNFFVTARSIGRLDRGGSWYSGSWNLNTGAGDDIVAAGMDMGSSPNGTLRNKVFLEEGDDLLVVGGTNSAYKVVTTSTGTGYDLIRSGETPTDGKFVDVLNNYSEGTNWTSGGQMQRYEVHGGEGNDTVLVKGYSSSSIDASVIDLGDGDDYLVVTGNIVGSEVTGGAGNDTIKWMNQSSSLDFSTVKSFENVVLDNTNVVINWEDIRNNALETPAVFVRGNGLVDMEGYSAEDVDMFRVTGPNDNGSVTIDGVNYMQYSNQGYGTIYIEENTIGII